MNYPCEKIEHTSKSVNKLDRLQDRINELETSIGQVNDFVSKKKFEIQNARADQEGMERELKKLYSVLSILDTL